MDATNYLKAIEIEEDEEQIREMANEAFPDHRESETHNYDNEQRQIGYIYATYKILNQITNK